MCSCDREVGERFLPYQLSRGTILETQARVPVTLGFVDRVCRECRGLAAESHPMAAIPGRTSKIKRFYWREIMFLTFKRFAERAEEAGLDLKSAHSQDAVDLRAEVQREVIEQIKQLHASNPKYDFSELSQSEVLSKYAVEVVRLDASFAPKTQAKGVGIFDDGEIVSAEEFIARKFRQEDWEVVFCESRPFHVLFAVYMWLVIHDPNDSLREMRGFAAKIDHPEYSVTKGNPLWTLHTPDFGTRGYGERRSEAIHQHLDALPQDRGELPWLFDYWIDGSAVPNLVNGRSAELDTPTLDPTPPPMPSCRPAFRRLSHPGSPARRPHRRGSR